MLERIRKNVHVEAQNWDTSCQESYQVWLQIVLALVFEIALDVMQLPYYSAGGRFGAKYIGKRRYWCIGKRLLRCIGKRSKLPKLLRRNLREREPRTYTAHTACTAYTACTACTACTAHTACTAANAWKWNGKRSNFEAANGLKLNRQTKTIFGSSISANGVKALEI